MNALKQYIDLYRGNQEAVNGHSSGALNTLRLKALAVLEADGARLPHRGDEGFEQTSVEEMFAPDFGINITRMDMPADIAASFRCAVPHMSTLLGVTVNDIFHPVGNLDSKLPEGVRFMSLARAAREYPDLVGGHYGSVAPLTDVSVALNTLLTQDGVFIHVAKGCNPDKPLQLVNLFSASSPVMAVRRVLIVVEDNASLQLLVCDHTQSADTSFLSDQVVEIKLGRNSRLDMCDIEESSARTNRYSRVWAEQGEGASLNHATVTLTCGTTRNDINVTMAGENADAFLAGMAIGDGDMHIDNETLVCHRVPRCRSNQLFKYALDGDSRGAFEGTIVVSDGAKFTEAYQTNRNILASAQARMYSKPQLEIYNDDVKCSHGATTGQLDYNALFYMQARGIPFEEARTMLMQAFMVDVIDTVAVEGLRDRLRHLVETRFRGDHGAACGECNKTCR